MLIILWGRYYENARIVSVPGNGNVVPGSAGAGHFDLKLIDIAGRAVYHLNAEGPKSFVLDRGTLRNGTYVAHIVSGGKKFEEKILIVQ